jgi:hypothetical protein
MTSLRVDTYAGRDNPYRLLTDAAPLCVSFNLTGDLRQSCDVLFWRLQCRKHVAPRWNGGICKN